jgi:cytidyltransferase-like protein
MLNFKTYFLLEGGAAGHMAHPFELPEIKTGKDLVNFFNKASNSLKTSKGTLKIDGLNVSLKVVRKDNILQFALDRGSMKPLDVEGITLNDLESRFGAGHGMVAAGEKTLTIFNEALPNILKQLQQLGMLQNSNIFLNTEFVQGQTNVLAYDHDFLAIHGVNKFVQATPKRRDSVEIPYDKQALASLIEEVNKVAKNQNFKVYGEVGVNLKKLPSFDKILNIPFTVIAQGQKITKPLIEFLNSASNPFNKQVTLSDGRSVSAMLKQNYINILNGTPLENFVKDKKDFDDVVDGAVLYHATRLLGDEILRHSDTDMGSADKHEGVVLRDTRISPTPVKITGSFILSGLQTPFKKSPEEGEEDENFDSPYLDQGGQNTPNSVYAYPGWGVEGRTLVPKPATFGEMVDMAVGTFRPESQKLIVVYPGRFQPFHLGHAAVYNKLKQLFPEAQVFIATSDATDKDTSPFTFDDKLQMIVSSGIHPQDVVKTAQPYKAPELLNKYDKSSARIIFVVGEKDMKGPNPRFKFGVKKDGSPTYFQRFVSKDKLEPIEKHGYIMTIPTVKFKLSDGDVKSASEIRDLYKRSNDNQRKQIITDLYGKFKPDVYNLFNKKLI